MIVGTLTHQVATFLREEILSGRLRPGEPILPNVIAEQLGVSRVPVREAVQKLVAESLIEQSANRSAKVSSLSPDELYELGLIVFSLEKTATCLGVEKIQDCDFSKMDRLLDRMRATEDNPVTWYEHNHEFHACMYRACGFTKLIQMIEDGRRNLMRFQTDTQMISFNADQFHDEHVALLTAARKRDRELVGSTLQAHFDNSIPLLIKAL